MSSRNRCNGSVAIEAIVAATLLITATATLARYGQLSRLMSRDADQRLATRLVAENTVLKLCDAAPDQIDQLVEALIETNSKSGNYETQIESKPFDVEGSSTGGIHFLVTCQVSGVPTTKQTFHGWQLPSVANDSSANSDLAEETAAEERSDQ